MNVDGVFRAVKEKWMATRSWLAVSRPEHTANRDMQRARNGKPEAVKPSARIDRVGVYLVGEPVLKIPLRKRRS